MITAPSTKYRIELLPLVKKNHAGARCNLHCRWCHNDYYKLHNSFDGEYTSQFERIITVLNSVKHYYTPETEVQISAAGEPALVGTENLAALIKMVREAVPGAIGMTTNGTVLREKDWQVLAGAGLAKINFSVNTFDPGLYRQITRKSGERMLPRVLANIKAAAVAGIDVSVNCVYSKMNNGEVASFIRFLEKTPGVRWKFFDLLNDENLYLPVQGLIDTIENMGYTWKTLQKGHYSFYRIDVGKSNLWIKISKETNDCPNLHCPVRPKCVEGCRSSVRISAEGIQPCGIRRDNVIAFDEIGQADILEKRLVSGGKLMPRELPHAG
jgi:molybdenum cofactor biosynthesis enzyme MoaA